MGKLYLGDSMLSERLLDIRDEAELNQEDMAEILKVSQSNYSRWENGKESLWNGQNRQFLILKKRGKMPLPVR